MMVGFAAPRYRLTSSRVLISTIITSAIVLCQLLLIHYYYGTIFNRNTGQQHSQNSLKSIYCNYGLLAQIQELAIQTEVELVLIDPELVDSRGQAEVDIIAINETSGGQPNLKLFYESLKNNGFVTLQYDSVRPMQPEVYRRASHLFDEAHELHKDGAGDEKVSKIYTEFLAHIFVLNRTSNWLEKNLDIHNRCNRQFLSGRPTVIHIIVLYNFEFDVQNQWIQPALILDELDKHKLLTYNVHWVDFRIPVEHHYLHPKKSIASISIANEDNINRQSLDFVRVFEPDDDRALGYVNNSFIYCTNSPFNISGLIDNEKRYGKYAMMLDNSRPDKIESGSKLQLQHQIDLAFQFMSTYSDVYGKLTHWLTGSSLLSFLKFCDLTVTLDENLTGSEMLHEPTIDLEFGVFASEFNRSIIEALANATEVGVRMVSDWRQSVIHFRLIDCPNVVFRIYLYELRKDFYQHYFITQNSMILSQKRNRKRSSKIARLTEEGPNSSWGHHVFGLHNLELCWTQLDGISKLFRVPCNIYDHLRRIFIV